MAQRTKRIKLGGEEAGKLEGEVIDDARCTAQSIEHGAERKTGKAGRPGSREAQKLESWEAMKLESKGHRSRQVHRS